MNWIPYKNSQGEWTERHGLILTAWPTGAWAVHCPRFSVKPQASELLFLPVEGGIEAAKSLAEEAALKMLKPANTQP